jgi:hypothetical protein
MGPVLPRTPDAGADKIKAIHFRVTFDPGVLVYGVYGSGSGQSILVSQFPSLWSKVLKFLLLVSRTPFFPLA